MLYATPRIDQDDRRVLHEIDGYYEALWKATGQARPREWLGGVRKRLVAGAIRGGELFD